MTARTTTRTTANNIHLNDCKPEQGQLQARLPTSDGKISWQHHGNYYNHTLQLVVGLVVVLVVIYIYVNDYKNTTSLTTSPTTNIGWQNIMSTTW